ARTGGTIHGTEAGLQYHGMRPLAPARISIMQFVGSALLMLFLAARSVAAAAQPFPNEESGGEQAGFATDGEEALYASPTRRDRIGRIIAPVIINGQGPFRFVVDTGATHSAISLQ